jgi:hypothetical protein
MTTLEFFNLFRRVHEEDKMPWYVFNGPLHAQRIRMPPAQWRRVQFEFEVDHRQRITLMMCLDGAPHYVIPGDIPAVPLRPAGEEPAAAPGGSSVSNAAGTSRPDLFDVTGRLRWDIEMVNPVSEWRRMVFAKGMPLDRTFHCHDGEIRKGMVMAGDPLEAFPEEGRYDLQSAERDGLLAIVERPAVTSAYAQRFRLTLDETGTLCVHAGEVPYWKTTSHEEFREQPGRVLVTQMQPARPRPKETDDPFNGRH